MKVTKVRRKSSYLMGTTKCMRVIRTDMIHSWSSISGHVNDWYRRLIRCMRRDTRNRKGKLIYPVCSDIEVGDSLGKRSRRGSIEEIGETGT